MRDRLAAIWPFFGIRLQTPRLELALPLDEDIVALAHLAAEGVHDPEQMPFFVPWTDLPSPELERSFLQYHWRRRSEWKPEDWTLEFAVYFAGDSIGIQGVGAKDFAVRRVVGTGSWLGRGFQGRGLGKEMRAAVLELAFAGLDAEYAETEAFEDNRSSIGVTRAMGYHPNGFEINAPRGVSAAVARFVLDRETWRGRRTVEVEISGLQPCLDLFGVGDRPPAPEES